LRDPARSSFNLTIPQAKPTRIVGEIDRVCTHRFPDV
jgi:hypothetical protein